MANAGGRLGYWPGALYRDALPDEEVLAIIEKDSPEALDADCVRVWRECLGDSFTCLLGLQLAIEAEAQDERRLCGLCQRTQGAASSRKSFTQ